MDPTLKEKLLDRKASELVANVLQTYQSTVAGTPKPDSKQLDFEIRNIDWVACKDFTISTGKTQIEEYMGTWEMDHRWMFSVEFRQEIQLEFEKEFLYRALWSMPTRWCPIPKNTAAVYFIITISRIKPPTSPVIVRFQVEYSETVHTPGKIRFREKWLEDVIESKSLLIDHYLS